MFLGTYEHQIDPKNRLTLPSTWRKLVDDKVVVTISTDNCIEIRTMKSYEDYTNTLMKLGSATSTARRIQRTIFANSSIVQIDSSNRILLPTTLINLAKITKSVVMFGVNDKIEVWNQEEYNNDKRIDDVKHLNEELESLSFNEK